MCEKYSKDSHTFSIKIFQAITAIYLYVRLRHLYHKYFGKLVFSFSVYKYLQVTRRQVNFSTPENINFDSITIKTNNNDDSSKNNSSGDESNGSPDPRAFKILFMAIVIDLIGFGIIIPILPFLVQEVDVQRQGILLAWLLTSYSMAQLVVAPLWGRLSDRIGRRPIILTGLLGSAITFSLFAFTTTYDQYLITRIMQGVFTAASLPTARAYIADITTPELRAKKFGILGAAFGIGFTFGPAIGSLLSREQFLIPELPTHATASLFAAGLALINFLLATKRLPETLHVGLRRNDRWSFNPFANITRYMQFSGVRSLFILFGITIMIFSAFESMFPLFANHVDNRINAQNIGFYFAGIGILIAVAQGMLVGPVVNRFGEINSLRLGILLLIIGYLVLSTAFNLITLFLFLIPLGLGAALVTPTINSALSSRIPEDQQGGVLGLNASVGALGRILGPLYGGFLFDTLIPSAPFLFGAVIMLIVLITMQGTLSRK
jgi:MFS family permease